MANLTGIVAILNIDESAVIEVRDLGPEPTPVKGTRVRPFVEVKPALTGDEYHDQYSDAIAASEITRTWTKTTPDNSALDLARLNSALSEEGSAFRALAEVTLEELNSIKAKTLTEINLIRAAMSPTLPDRTPAQTGLAQRTPAQLKTALLAKMRTPL